jgi:hypothetical protein
MLRRPAIWPELKGFRLAFGCASSRICWAASHTPAIFPTALSATKKRTSRESGGRITGLTLGLLDVQTEPVSRLGVPASNYGVMRVKRAVLERSSVGGFFINRETGTADFNRVIGADANFIFYKYLNIGGLLSKSDAPGVTGDDPTTSGGVTWQSDFVDTGITWLTVDKNFRDDLGCVPRKNQRRFLPLIGLHPRPKNSRLFRQLVFRYQGEYVNTQANILETRINHYTFEMRFKSGAIGAVAPHTRFEQFFVPFEIRPGIVIPPGGYSCFFNNIRYRSNPALRFSWSGMWQNHAGLFWRRARHRQLQPLPADHEFVLGRSRVQPQSRAIRARNIYGREG